MSRFYGYTVLRPDGVQANRANITDLQSQRICGAGEDVEPANIWKQKNNSQSQLGVSFAGVFLPEEDSPKDAGSVFPRLQVEFLIVVESVAQTSDSIERPIPGRFSPLSSLATTLTLSFSTFSITQVLYWKVLSHSKPDSDNIQQPVARAMKSGETFKIAKLDPFASCHHPTRSAYISSKPTEP